jgi:iron complex transport system substrate-binding protein
MTPRAKAIRRTARGALLACCVACGVAAAADRAELAVRDDRGALISLAAPARRIVSLAPHITELLFAVGAGDRLVATVDYSDYPDAARRIARVGSVHALDLERVLSLRPDLIVVWLHGSPQRQIERLALIGVPTYYSEPRRLDDVASTLERFGRLAATEAQARRAARDYRERLSALRARYSGRAPVDVFYQVWNRPLLTVNDAHLISDVLRLCGGRNVFGSLATLVPTVSLEAVLQANPQAIIASSEGPQSDAGTFAPWRAWPRLAAVAQGALFAVDADTISRQTPRILDATQTVCERLEAVRARMARGGKSD